MRSDVKYLAKCGRESLYFCHAKSGTYCGRSHPNCIYTPKTLETPKQKNKIHPIVIELSELFINALASNLLNTAWCIDLARTAIVWELIAKAEGKPDLFVQNKIRYKIEKDKGVKY